MSLEPLLEYLKLNAAEMDHFGTISPSFTSTGVAFETNTYLETEVTFELPPLLLADIIKDYRRAADADRACAGQEPYPGDDICLILLYDTDILVNHVLVYTRKRKLALLGIS